jgi:3-dehydroquinate synthase
LTVLVKLGLLAQLNSNIVSGAQVFIVTNEIIAPHYLSLVQQQFSDKQCDFYLLPDGEKYKTLEIVEKITEKLIANHHRRDTTIVGLGGGVVCDLAGFIAATYLRGVKLVQMPTSLLAQVDAAIGGKNGVNHPLAKNSIGTFYQPEHVLIDSRALITLDDRHYQAALSEVLKYGLVYDAEFFMWLETNWRRVVEKEPDIFQQMIQRCVDIKLMIVEQDEKDHGIRQILNFGHTLGHALEQCSDYELLHGEAVAAGILWALSLSEKHCGLDRSIRPRVKSLLSNAPSYDLGDESLWQAMARDKKHRHKFVLILLEQLGRAKLVEFNALADLTA